MARVEARACIVTGACILPHPYPSLHLSREAEFPGYPRVARRTPRFTRFPRWLASKLDLAETSGKTRAGADGAPCSTAARLLWRGQAREEGPRRPPSLASSERVSKKSHTG